MESPMLTPKETAEYLRLSVYYIYQLCNKKDFPAVLIGGRWRIHKYLLDQWWFAKFKENQTNCAKIDEWGLTKDRYWTLTEAAKYLKLPKHYMFQLVGARGFPGAKVEHQWRIRKDLLEDWAIVNKDMLDEMHRLYYEGDPKDRRRGQKKIPKLEPQMKKGISYYYSRK